MPRSIVDSQLEAEMASFASTRRARMESDTQDEQPLIRPKHNRRQSSISGVLDRFMFPRRRATNDTDFSTSTVLPPLPPSRLPTPAGISRSSSFFRNLGPFSSKPPDVPAKDALAASVTEQDHTSFENQVPASRGTASTPYPGHPQRNQSVQISQRGLMQPIRPGVPRSTTVGNLSHRDRSDRTPSFMRSTSSSARRQSLSGSLGLPSSSRQHRPTPRPSTGPTVKETYPQKEQEKANQHSMKPSNTFDDIFSLSPAKEEEEIEYATDEEIEIGVATPMTISPIRSVSSHNPYSPNNFAYGTPSKHDKGKRDSGKPFEHLLARPVPFDLTPTRINRKPLPELTPDRSKSQQYDGGHSEEMSQLTHRDSAEYYRRRNTKPIERSTSDLLLDLKDDYNVQSNSLLGRGKRLPRSDSLQNEIYRPEDVFFTDEVMDHGYEEEDTVVHNVGGQLIKGSFANASSSEAATEANDGANDQGDNDLTTSTITAPSHSEANPQLITTSLPFATWLGRLTALSDRFRTEALAESMNSLPALSIHDIARPTHITHPMHDDNRRYHRVFMHLHNLCTTDEARASLREFQAYWEGKRSREYGGSGSGIGVALGSGHGTGGAGRGGAGAGSMKSSTGDGSSGKVKEKRGVFEKLGLRRKSGV